MKALIILVYFDRPNMVRNALNSIASLDTDAWELAFIDDGSITPGRPIVEDILGDNYLPRIKFYRLKDTIEDKVNQGGSRHGHAMNMAIEDSNADIGVVLCDDDALTPQGIGGLLRYYTNNPGTRYCYSHVIVFDPTKQIPGEHLTKTSHWLNRFTTPVRPSCQLDSSQVSYRLRNLKLDGLKYEHPKTGALDAGMFDQLAEKYGPAPFSGTIVQYKAIFNDQMGNRDVNKMYYPLDEVYAP